MSDEVRMMYETSGELDEDTFVNLSLCNLWLPKERNKNYIYSIVMIIMSLWLLYMQSEHAVILLAFSVLLLGLFIYLPFVVKRKSRIQFKENAPDGILAYTSSFCDDKILITNHTHGGNSDLPLCQVKKIYAVNEIWALVSKGGMVYPVFPAHLSETDRQSLLGLLKQNNPKIKIQLPKKK